MPCLRGLEVSLTTKPVDQQIPEYPHPEGSSARLLGLATTSIEGSYGFDRRTQPICPSQYHKSSPTISVYIPSIPGSRFAVSYTVNTIPPAPCKFIFFRLYINSRPIAAWGVDLARRTRGKVVKSLWAPGARYNDQVGFEGRNFVFLPGEENKSVAEDGGLIEVQAFRAKERRARSARLEEFRYQENYSIAAPSVGLVDQPQDASFYDWHLLDAKDCPFTCFRFHYRSFKNLEDLNLIPPNELSFIQSRSPKPPKRPALVSIDSELCSPLERLSCISENSELDEAVFVDCKAEQDSRKDMNSKGPCYVLKSPPERFAASATRANLPQPSKIIRDGFRESYLQRPLPELPIHEPTAASRRSSAASAAPSITPSLRQYLDEDSFALDEVEMGIAQLVHLPPPEPSIPPSQDDEFSAGIPADYSISNYELSPQSTNDSISESMLSPSTYMPMTGTKFERGLSMFTSPKQARQPPPIPPRSEARRHAQTSQGFLSECQLPEFSGHNLTRAETLTITESQWMSRSPSPTSCAHIAEGNGVRRPWTPHPERDQVAGRSIFSGFLKKKRSRSPSKLAGLVIRRLSPTKPERPQDDNMAPGGRVGNWI
ncbi:hypothetical protein QBC43DRAFT_356669 [Cladorrhinum sp. PSN259]|nr:hypothetical protein QBC43DRAFT_356669 [Cladorrhinum sp. PSN259]